MKTMPASGADQARDDEQHEAQAAAAHAGIERGVRVAADGVDAPAGRRVLQDDGEDRRQHQERHDGPRHRRAGDVVDAEIGERVGEDC